MDNREDPIDVVEEVVDQVMEGTKDKEDKEVFNEVTKMILLRIQLKLNTALLSHCPSVCHRRDISHFSHI